MEDIDLKIKLDDSNVQSATSNILAKMTEMQGKIEQIEKGYKQGFGSAAESVDKSNKKLVELSSGLEQATSKINDQKKSIDGSSAAIKDNTRLMNLWQSATKGFIALLPALGGMAIIQQIGSFFQSSSQKAKEFEKAISSLSSITGATGADLEFYKEQAAEIGRTTTRSAVEAVKAFELIGSARPELLKNKEALALVTKEAITLSEAAGIDLPTAAAALTGALNQFQLPSSEAARVINALAAGSKEGAVAIPLITESLDKFAPAAAAFNVSVEESIALIEALGEQGAQGAEAGTQLRNVLGKMSTIKALPKEAVDQLKKFGVNLNVVSDSSLPLNERLQEMSKISGDATALQKVFGDEARIAGQIILSNVDKVKKYTDAVTGTQTAVEQAAINNDTLAGDTSRLNNAIDGLKTAFGQFLNEGVRPLVKGLTTFILAIAKIPEFIKENKVEILALGTALIALNAKQIVASASALGMAAKLKIMTAATRAATIANGLLNAVINANPIVRFITIVSALAIGMVQLYKRSETVRAGFAGIANVAKELFKIVKETFSGFIEGFNLIKDGDVLSGLKKIGTSLIKFNPVGLAVTEGSRLKDSFVAGFNNKKAEIKTDEMVKAFVKIGETVGSKIGENGFVIKTKVEPEKEGAGLSEEEAARRKEQQKAELARLKELEKAYLDIRDRIAQAVNNAELETLVGADRIVAEKNIALAAIDELQKEAEKAAKEAGKKLDPAQFDKLRILAEQQFALQLSAFQSQEIKDRIDFEKTKIDLINGLIQESTDSLLTLEEQKRALSLENERNALQARLQEQERYYTEVGKINDEGVQRELELLKLNIARVSNEETRLRDEARIQRLNEKLRELDDTRNFEEQKLELLTVSGDRSLTLEMFKERERLRIRKEFLLKEMALLEQMYGPNSPEVLAVRRQMELINTEIAQGANNLPDPMVKLKEGLANALGVTGEQLDAIGDALSAGFNQYLNYVEGMARHAEDKLKAISDQRKTVEDELKEEEKLQLQGLANNVESKKKELDNIAAEEARAEREAEKRRKEATRAQLIAEGAQQLSAITTAVANIIKGFSTIPILGYALGIGAGVAMLGSWIALKAKAKDSVKLYTGGALDEHIPGPSRDSGQVKPHGRDDRHTRGYRVEGTNLELGGDEFVVKSDVTRENLPFLKEFNRGRFRGLNLKALAESAKQGRELARGVRIHQRNYNIWQRQENERLTREAMQAIMERSSDKLIHYFEKQQEQIIPMADGRVIKKKGNNITITNMKS